MNSTINLFKALIITNKTRKKITKEFLEKTIKYGVLFTPEVISNYKEDELIKIAKELGDTSEQLNNSFHKCWNKVKTAPMQQLLMEQIIHYFTTYGLESVGAYNESTVFIPAETLDIIKTEISFIIIKGYTKEEIKEKLLTLLETGIALKEETIEEVLDICKIINIENEINNIKNKEVKIALSLRLNIIPEDPVEFLRMLIYQTTKKTLLIKDRKTIEMIKKNATIDLNKLFVKYEKNYGYEKLSSIFYRFKPIFLAFKINTQMKQVINKIRKLAIKNHQPMFESYLNNITAHLDSINKAQLEIELNKVNIFRKIRLAYALKYRTIDTSSIMYKIRNGKGYSTEFNFNKFGKAKEILHIVMNSIIKDMNVKGKKIYIPSYIHYALPSTEKQFTGVFPSGTYITTPKDMVFGVHWTDVNTNRIDLDLSLINEEEKMGWDGDWRNENGILFSGDMTSAPKPNGASEFFYIKRQLEKSYLVTLNYFNYNDNTPISFQIIIGKQQPSGIHENRTINPNNILAITNSLINQKQKILGLLIMNTKECKFYFSETYVGKSITSSGTPYAIHSKKYLFDYYKNTISLNELLEKAGAKLVDKKEECDIDLSPQTLEKDTIINLITGSYK